MKQVSIESLKGCARVVRRHSDPEGTADTDYVAFGMAAEYLRAVVGNEWTNQMVFEMHPTVDRANREGREFMRAEGKAAEDRYRLQERTLHLAELLFNLQSVEGIDGRIDNLRVGNLEATYAELEMGAFITSRAVAFKYIDPRGVTGSDFDGLVTLSEGERVNCEMKCKVEGAELSDGAIRNPLAKPARSCPREGPA